MENFSVNSEIFRLKKKKCILERQESALLKMLEMIDNQLLGLEVEELQLASNLREQMKEDPTCDESGSDHESDTDKPQDTEEFHEDDNLNKTQLDLDSRLDEMLSGQFYVEEDEDDEIDELMLT